MKSFVSHMWSQPHRSNSELCHPSKAIIMKIETHVDLNIHRRKLPMRCFPVGTLRIPMEYFTPIDFCGFENAKGVNETSTLWAGNSTIRIGPVTR